MAGNLGFCKTVKKSEHWAKHGKHKGGLILAMLFDRLKPKKHPTEMFPTVREAFERGKRENNTCQN